MLQEPATSPYDLQFNFLGFQVRITWGFWIVAAVLGWTTSDLVDRMALNRINNVEMDSPGAPILLCIWIVALFISILVHELGHSLAMRYYGMNSRIVLYHFGGMAIPDSFGSWRGARLRNLGPREQVVISAAGPVLQILLGITFLAIAVGLGLRTLETNEVDYWFGTSLKKTNQVPSSAVVLMFFHGMVWPSIYWAIFNLAPILPLDGGHIMRGALFLSKNQQPARTAHMVSVVAGAVIGLWFLSAQQPFAGIMFLVFAASNWQAMQGVY
jgi:stage IV sporulation protein FB